MKHTKLIQTALSLLLCAALILGLWLPGVELAQKEPEDPLTEESVREISVLKFGEQSGEMNTVKLISGGAASESEDGEEEEEPENTPEPTSKPQKTEDDTPSTGDGDEGQEDGLQGDEGGDELTLDLALVMGWYRYGSERRTIVCSPASAVSRSVNTAQLKDDLLRYDFELTGEDAKHVEILSVTMAEGDAPPAPTAQKGEFKVTLPEGGSRDYTFVVKALSQKRNEEGQKTNQELSFTYVLHCEYALDLELTLEWQRKNDTPGTVTCAADDTAARTIESHELTEGVLAYTPRLSGALAEGASITKGEFRTDSGETGNLNVSGGSLVMKPAPGKNEERYYFTFTVTHGSETVLYTFNLLYRDTLDVKLKFTWLQGGTTPVSLLCQSGGSSSTDIRGNQLSAGAVKYEMELTGGDAAGGKIVSVNYTSEGAGGGTLQSSGSLPMTLANGASSNSYVLSVRALVKGQWLDFQIRLNYAMDVSLEMRYSILSGARQLRCENGKTVTAEAIYDDELEDGALTYTMAITGADAANVRITEVRLYQSGSGRTTSLTASETVQLLLKNGRTGENAFTVLAKSSSDEEYKFTLNIPYKHRGEANVVITTNLTDGMVVTNEAKTNLTVAASSRDASGNVISHILATGSETKLIVQLDGETLSYVSSSGTSQEYDLYPKNPPSEDTNEHTVYIYAEDEYGNYGEKTVKLKGIRAMEGQKKGTAQIYIDLTVLGMPVLGPKEYDVLHFEPISYVIEKAVFGKSFDTWGTAKETFDFSGTSRGTLDDYYLASIDVRSTQGLQTLTGERWDMYGATVEEQLAAIDAQFGRGSGLATLWRCIRRNGLNKSVGSGSSFGEMDYTSGSGWTVSIGGLNYYPGQGVSNVFLEPNQILTLRYTLAGGWESGGGNAGYSNSGVGYCVTAMNGSWAIRHQWEEQEDGSSVCKCCGLVELCKHENTTCTDLGDGSHIDICDNVECGAAVGTAEAHTLLQEETQHKCEKCGFAEAHDWRPVEGSDTATCTAPGVKEEKCAVCSMTHTVESPAAGHQRGGNYWYHDPSGHFQKCQVPDCGAVIEESRGSHSYQYNAAFNDYFCAVCSASHDWDSCGNAELSLVSESCTEKQYHCPGCGYDMVGPGEGHRYTDGICTGCGAPDPDAVPPSPPPSEPPSEPEHTHSYTGTVTGEPGCGAEGTMTYSCGCGDSYTEPIPPTGAHSYAGGACSVCGAADPNAPPPEMPDPEQGQEEGT